MNSFERRDGALWCEGVALVRIAEEVGTPAYVYSRATIERHYRVFDEGLWAAGDHLVCYSVKASSNLAILKLMADLGSGFDAVSGGEIFRVKKAGGQAHKIVFSGVGKRDDEIAYALDEGILMFNVESHAELVAIERVARAKKMRAPVSLRINPDVDAKTHPYISTGLKENKFGIAMADARRELAFARGLSHVELIGLDCHIGSQLTETGPFEDALGKMSALCVELIDDGCEIRYLDVGGGLGIPYRAEVPPSPSEYGEMVARATRPLKGRGVRLICEPGRVIVGNAGLLLTRTQYVKRGETKNFVIVDAAMNDLIRPTLYDSFHAIEPVAQGRGDKMTADVVGPICETGDFFARDRELAWTPEEGDLLAIRSTGAYGASMASNYNSRPRAPEVLVEGDAFRVVRTRETLDDLVRNEVV